MNSFLTTQKSYPLVYSILTCPSFGNSVPYHLISYYIVYSVNNIILILIYNNNYDYYIYFVYTQYIDISRTRISRRVGPSANDLNNVKKQQGIPHYTNYAGRRENPSAKHHNYCYYQYINYTCIITCI